MSCTQLLPGLGNAAEAIGRPQIVRNFTVCRSLLAMLTQLAIGLAIMGLIVIGLTNPSGAQPTDLSSKGITASTQKQGGISTVFAHCLQAWDPETHMTKKEWSGACHRLLIEREDYLPNRRQ